MPRLGRNASVVHHRAGEPGRHVDHWDRLQHVHDATGKTVGLPARISHLPAHAIRHLADVDWRAHDHLDFVLGDHVATKHRYVAVCWYVRLSTYAIAEQAPQRAPVRHLAAQELAVPGGIPVEARIDHGVSLDSSPMMRFSMHRSSRPALL